MITSNRSSNPNDVSLKIQHHFDNRPCYQNVGGLILFQILQLRISCIEASMHPDVDIRNYIIMTFVGMSLLVHDILYWCIVTSNTSNPIPLGATMNTELSGDHFSCCVHALKLPTPHQSPITLNTWSVIHSLDNIPPPPPPPPLFHNQHKWICFDLHNTETVLRTFTWLLPVPVLEHVLLNKCVGTGSHISLQTAQHVRLIYLYVSTYWFTEKFCCNKKNIFSKFETTKPYSYNFVSILYICRRYHGLVIKYIPLLYMQRASNIFPNIMLFMYTTVLNTLVPKKTLWHTGESARPVPHF